MKIKVTFAKNILNINLKLVAVVKAVDQQAEGSEIDSQSVHLKLLVLEISEKNVYSLRV